MLRKLVVPILAALTLTVSASVTAQAATLDIVDARGDVHRIDNNTGTFVVADGEQRADILRTRVQHTDRALVVRTRLLRLDREGREVGMAMRIRTNDGTYRVAELTAGRRIGWRGETTLSNRRGSTVPCRTRHSIDYANDVMAFRIPSSCLGNPRWVQTTLVTVFFGGRQLLADNPHNSTMRINRVWTGRIRRG
jgi:glutamine amidotransferase-like uncharacterized protein